MDRPIQLTVRYEGHATDNGADFAVLGPSFIGFDQLLRELFAISKINGTVEVRTEKIEHGSVLETVNLLLTLNGPIFENPAHLLEFLQVAAPEIASHAKEAMSALKSADDALNDFYKNRPLDADNIRDLVIAYLSYLFGKHRGKTPKSDERLPDRVQGRLENLYKKGRFKKALSPLRENGYDKITVAQRNLQKKPLVVITDSDLADYLPEEDQILPYLRNGDVISFTAKLVGLSSTRGEVVSLRIAELDKRPTIYHAYPQGETDTSAFKDFYGQDVLVEAEVVRKGNNLYKKPDFNIISIDAAQTSLNLMIASDEKSSELPSQGLSGKIAG